MQSTTNLIDAAWQAGKLPGPATVAWLKSLPAAAALAELKKRDFVSNPIRRDFGDDEAAYNAFVKAQAQGDIRVHGAARR